MFGAIAKTLGQTGDPAFRRVFLRSLAASLAAFIGLWFLAWLVFSLLGGPLAAWTQSLDLWGPIETTLLFLFDAGAFASVVIASFFLFPAVMAAIMAIFLEEIAAAVEAKHYPARPPARVMPISQAIRSSLGLIGMTILLNLLALPFYALLLFLPPLNLALFYLVNGHLLGREYFELVAFRRLELAEVAIRRRRHRGKVLFGGAFIAFFLTLPFVNILAPIFATAFMLHLYESLANK